MSVRKRRSILDILEDYFEDLEEEFERWRDTLLEKPSWNCKAYTMEPLRDMRLTPTEVIVTVDLPLTEENTMQVRPIGRNTLDISAKMRRKIRFDDFGITHHKGEFQTFNCHMRIPVPVNMDAMQVRFKKGILEIHLPRKHE